MPRSSTMLAVVLGLIISPLSTSLVATPAGAQPATVADPTALPAPHARESVSALETAGRVLAGARRATDPSATVALRDLWLARPDLAGAEALEATSLLARPTDGAADRFNDGYTVPAASECGVHVCVHYVTTTNDAPRRDDWVAVTLSTMESVYEQEVNGLGYRAPRSDGERGGDGRLDVYLKDLGIGLYGYCAAERRTSARTASGFCVLDDDYARKQFPTTTTTPTNNLVVTAAHEFFHAIQYSYDFAEDPWMMESTATWMEEQVGDDINDNRQYLADSQLQAPYVPLDAFSASHGFQYGNWIFWQYLTQRFGNGFVRKAWESAGSRRHDGQRYSIEALRAVLHKKKLSFTDVYADYAAANVTPSLTYAEAPGAPEYADPKPLADVTLSRAVRRDRQVRKQLDHLSAYSTRLRPAAELSSHKWRLRVHVKGPQRSSSPAGRLVLQKVDGSISTRRLRFTARGSARATAPFSSEKIVAVTVSFANVSTRFRCGRRSDLSCAGVALDDDKRFVVDSLVFKHRKNRQH